ncbi:hypothetical protein [Phaffia rhodozyma]|uniref:Uncharacterized protein n=1 Tax=Phaffia rhodozyma TaxID=264483 RepID=A0A0F7SNQ1_PHARH|nr:hypothetical protein [Phaffia rhodozyma]
MQSSKIILRSTGINRVVGTFPKRPMATMPLQQGGMRMGNKPRKNHMTTYLALGACFGMVAYYFYPGHNNRNTRYAQYGLDGSKNDAKHAWQG